MADLRDLLKATLDELIYGKKAAQPVAPEFDPNRPWDAPSLRAAPVQPQVIQATPAPQAWLDPYAEALRLAERQQAIQQLTSPMSPVLDVTIVAPKLKPKEARR